MQVVPKREAFGNSCCVAIASVELVGHWYLNAAEVRRQIIHNLDSQSCRAAYHLNVGEAIIADAEGIAFDYWVEWGFRRYHRVPRCRWDQSL